MEIKIKIEAPELVDAMNRLSDVLAAKVSGVAEKVTATPDQPVAEATAPVAVVTPPEVEVPAAVVPPAVEAPAPVVTAPVVEAPAPVVAPPAPPAPPTPPTAPLTIQTLSIAGASLLDTDPNAMAKLIQLMGAKYGVAAITQLKPEQFGEFAADLRAMGANI